MLAILKRLKTSPISDNRTFSLILIDLAKRRSCVNKLSPFVNLGGNVIGLMIWLNGVRGRMTVTLPSGFVTRRVRASRHGSGGLIRFNCGYRPAAFTSTTGDGATTNGLRAAYFAS